MSLNNNNSKIIIATKNRNNLHVDKSFFVLFNNITINDDNTIYLPYFDFIVIYVLIYFTLPNDNEKRKLLDSIPINLLYNIMDLCNFINYSEIMPKIIKKFNDYLLSLEKIISE